MRWLAAARLSRFSSALVAEVQAEATLMLGAKSGGKGLSESPGGQLFNSEQDIIWYMPSVHEIWGRVNTVVLCNSPKPRDLTYNIQQCSVPTNHLNTKQCRLKVKKLFLSWTN